MKSINTFKQKTNLPQTGTVSLDSLTDASGNSLSAIVASGVNTGIASIAANVAADDIVQAAQIVQLQNIENSISEANTNITNLSNNYVSVSQRTATLEGERASRVAANTYTASNSYTGSGNTTSITTGSIIIGSNTGTTLSTYNAKLRGSSMVYDNPIRYYDASYSVADNRDLTHKYYVDTSISTAVAANKSLTDASFNSVAIKQTAMDSSLNLLQTTAAYLSSNNAFTGSTNTFSSIPALSTDKTTSDYTSTRQLTNKAYVDAKYDTLFNSEQTFNNRVNLKEVKIADWATFSSGPSGSLVNTNIEGPSTFLGANRFTANNIFDATTTYNGVATFKAQPKFDASANITDTDDNSILPASYTKKIKQNFFNYSESTTMNEYTVLGGYDLIAPNLANIGNQTPRSIKKCSVDLSFFSQTASTKNLTQSITTTFIGPSIATVRISCYFIQANAVATFTTSAANTVSRATAFTNADIILSANTTPNSNPISSPITIIEGTYILGLNQNSTNARDLYVRPLSQTAVIVPATQGNTHDTNFAYKTTQVMFDGTSYAFSPFVFSYVDTSTVRITFNVPCFLNRPNKNGWISSFGYNAQLVNGGYNVLNIGNDCGAKFINAQIYTGGNS